MGCMVRKMREVTMKVLLEDIRPLLVSHRIFLMGPGVRSVEDSGRSYPPGAIVSFDKGLKLEPYSTFWSGAGRHLVSMGAFSYTGSPLPGSVKIGRYSSIARGLKVMGNSHPIDWASTSPIFHSNAAMAASYQADQNSQMAFHPFAQSQARVDTGNDVWIGEDVMLARGIRIGDGAVVAARAVVTKDVQPYSVVGGVPAKVIRSRFDDSMIEELARSRWWKYLPHELSGFDVRTPASFARAIAEAASSGALTEFSPTALNDAEINSFVER